MCETCMLFIILSIVFLELYFKRKKEIEKKLMTQRTTFQYYFLIACEKVLLPHSYIFSFALFQSVHKSHKESPHFLTLAVACLVKMKEREKESSIRIFTAMTTL